MLTYVQQNGHSVLLHVTSFLHYFYIQAPVGFGKNDCDAFKVYLESQAQKAFGQHSAIVASVQMAMKMDIYGFQGNQNSPYLKISVGEPRNINRLRNLVRERNANWKGLWSHYSAEDTIETYDNIQYVLRFMIDTKVGSRLLFLEHS